MGHAFVPELGREIGGRVLDLWRGHDDAGTPLDPQRCAAYRNTLRAAAARPAPPPPPDPGRGERLRRVKLQLRHPCPHKGEKLPGGCGSTLYRCTLDGAAVNSVRPCPDAARDCPTCPHYPEPSEEATVPVPDEPTVDQAAALLRSRVLPWPKGHPAWGSAAVREAHVRLLRDRLAAVPAPAGAGRGVVQCVSAKGGWSSGKHLEHGYLPAAWVVVSELRRLGCTLPVTWCHLGPAEFDDHLRGLVEPLGVTVIDLREWEQCPGNRMRILAGWESKIAAVYASGYREVLFLDADSLPVRDPTYLFDAPEYRATGAAFWPDVPPAAGGEWLPEVCWHNCGLAYPGRGNYRDFESGQFVVDTRRCARGLWAARFLNEHSDYYYQFLFGDKSTFHLGFRAAGDVWAMPARGPGGTGASLHQYDFRGEHLFDHWTRNKPTLNGWPNPGVLRHRAECEGHLARLRSLWDGRLWSRTADPETAARLAGTRWKYDRVGIGHRPLELKAGGEVGAGAAGRERRWAVSRGADGTPVLAVLGDDGAVTMFLRPDGAKWVGRWEEFERGPVTLTPEANP